MEDKFRELSKYLIWPIESGSGYYSLLIINVGRWQAEHFLYISGFIDHSGFLGFLDFSRSKLF
jgi:hypothetical protein